MLPAKDCRIYSRTALAQAVVTLVWFLRGLLGYNGGRGFLDTVDGDVGGSAVD